MNDEEPGARGLLGRHSRMTPVLSGSWNIPPVWFALAFVTPGLAAVCFSLFSWGRWLVTGAPASPEAPFMFVWGLGFGAAGAILLAVRRRLLWLSGIKDLGAHIGIDAECLQQDLEDHGVKPRFIVNGQPYYDPAELGGFADLLRPAAETNPPLLRPLGFLRPPSDSLLRPSDVDSETIQVRDGR